MALQFGATINQVFDLFRSFVELYHENEPVEIGHINVPLVPREVLPDLLTSIIQIFKNEQPVPNIVGNCIVVGDLHGHLFQLANIIKKYGYPSKYQYIFLGDYVDRGQFSLEVIVFVFLLKYKFRKSVILLRGNHEVIDKNYGHDFTEFLYKNKIDHHTVDLFSGAFDEMPIACLLNNDIICVHGGIGPNVSLNALRTLLYPIRHQDFNPLVTEILWSDPVPIQTNDFKPNPRGCGVLFNGNAFEHFLQMNGLRMMIRAHSLAEEGFSYFFNGTLITVFSASNYLGFQGNSGAVIEVKENGEILSDK